MSQVLSKSGESLSLENIVNELSEIISKFLIHN